MRKKTEKKKKEKKTISRAEFFFNIASLVIVIGIGVYFGGRSLYYYSKQSNASKKEAGTLVEKILENNSVTKEENGFHQVEDGYLFVGAVENNYLRFSGRIFRILKVNKDHTIKVVSEENQTILPFGENENYEGSNLENWLTKKENVETSGVFYQSLTDAYNNLVQTSYCEGTLTKEKVKCSGKQKKDYVTLLSIEDYLNASSKDGFLNNGKISWLLGKEEDSVVYMNEEGMIEKGLIEDGYGVRPVITLEKRCKYLTGDGSKENPYQIEEEKKTKVGDYISLGTDLYQVYREDDSMLYLSLDGYLTLDGKEILLSYDPYTTQFDPNTRANIAYYLNNTYLYKLSYRDFLQDFQVYTGEISQEEGMNYLNQYKSNVVVKIGLLSIADLKINPQLDEYYLSNTTSSVGDSGYINTSMGMLKTGDVAEEKHIVPTIAILKDQINQGEGTKENPYRVE